MPRSLGSLRGTHRPNSPQVQTLKTAIEAARVLLRVDDVVKATRKDKEQGGSKDNVNVREDGSLVAPEGSGSGSIKDGAAGGSGTAAAGGDKPKEKKKKEKKEKKRKSTLGTA